MPIGLADTGRVLEGPDRERKRGSAVVRNWSSALFSELMFFKNSTSIFKCIPFQLFSLRHLSIDCMLSHGFRFYLFS